MEVEVKVKVKVKRGRPALSRIVLEVEGIVVVSY
jgi:hypothetical protein